MSIVALEEVSHVLDEAELTWWLDSGTLLGLVREGRILPWDGDVDIACWAKPARWDYLRRTLELKPLGYRGMIYGFTGSHPDLPALSLKVLRRSGEVVWCPSRDPKINPYPRRSLRWMLFGGVRRLWTTTTILNRSAFTEHASAKLGLTFSTFLLPSRFFDAFTSLTVAGSTFRVPADFEALLGFRYGDWRSPDRDWTFRRDDPAFRPHPPDRLVTFRPSAPFIQHRITERVGSQRN